MTVLEPRFLRESGQKSSCLSQLLGEPAILGSSLDGPRLCLSSRRLLSVCCVSSHRDIGHWIRAPVIQCDLILATSAKDEFPNKVTF